MLSEGHLFGERVWFYDTRSPARRMGVSTHPFDSTVVISLWQGDCCTGTFRLPTAEAARLISTLAYGMAEVVPEEGTGSGGPPGPPRRRWSHLVRRVVGRWAAQPGTNLRLLK